MSTEQTSLAIQIESANLKSTYNDHALKFIKHRIILAWIVRECIAEFSDYDIEFIMNHCFANEPLLKTIAVDQDTLDADSMINGSNTVDISAKEGSVIFDIVFDLILPNKVAGEAINEAVDEAINEAVDEAINEAVDEAINKATGDAVNEAVGDTSDEVDIEPVHFTVNIEIQKDENPGYPLVCRAIYYLARLISRQKGTAFVKDHYEKLHKVYSIWICTDTAKKRRNTIIDYSMDRHTLYGPEIKDDLNCDKMSAIFISLLQEENKSDNKIIRLLSVIFSKDIDPIIKKQLIEEEFGIPMTKEMEKEMNKMVDTWSE
ncbi:PD-(D/E)XK nuclease family transposase, partial [Lachnospiraceae bacterium NE2001]